MSKKFRIIGNMTGNSMDAIDVLLTEFDGDKMTDICSYSVPYSKDMQKKMEYLRANVRGKNKAEILAIPHFEEICKEYVEQVAGAVNRMLEINRIDKKSVDAIGFHGKTLDHNPPSVAKKNGTMPYTLQIGSGQMLADLTGIKVVYDFRSAYIQNGFDGAPLVPPHNAHVAKTEGDGCYYNAGNTSNFAIVSDGVAQMGADAGPCNEYIDAFLRKYSDEVFDKNGEFGLKGSLDKDLLQKLFDFGRSYYELPLPKSGDPQYYHTNEIFAYIEKFYGLPVAGSAVFDDVVHTLEYFAAYVAMQALTLIDTKMPLPKSVVLFGGGWKNPVVRSGFEKLLAGKDYVLPEHDEQFAGLLKRFDGKPVVRYSPLGEFMEARLFADLARYKLEKNFWPVPEVVVAGKSIIAGNVVQPSENSGEYTDVLNSAACGWQRL